MDLNEVSIDDGDPMLSSTNRFIMPIEGDSKLSDVDLNMIRLVEGMSQVSSTRKKAAKRCERDIVN